MLGYMLASKHLYAFYSRLSLYLMIGINVGNVVAVFFGNYLYQISSNNMFIPVLVFATLDVLLFLPCSLKFIPPDSATKISH